MMNEAIVAVQPKPLVMVLDEAVKKEEKAKNIMYKTLHECF